MRRVHKCVAVAALGVAFGALPGVPAFAQDRAEYKTIDREDMPREVRHAADRQAGGASDVKYQRQTRNGKTFYTIHFTKNGDRLEARLDESGNLVDGPHRARDQSDDGRSRSDDSRSDSRSGDDDVRYHGIATGNAKREIPRDVLDTMNQHTGGAKDLFYQRQERGGKTFYSVHYTKDNKRQFIRVAENGQLAVGPREAGADGGSASADASRSDRSRSGSDDGRSDGRVSERRDRERDYDRQRQTAEAGARREAISADDLPADVRRTIERTTGNGGGHTFYRLTRGDEVSYLVEWDVGEQRTSEIVGTNGKVLVASPLAGVASNPQPTPNPGSPTPVPAQAEAAAQLAAAREAAAAAASAPYQLLSDAGQLPPAVRQAVEQPLAGVTTAPLFQRFTENGRTLYSVHYTTPEGRRNFMAVDSGGKVVIEPRKSNWQEGGKNATFEVVGAGQLPAEVRQAIEQQGGTNHLFLQRTEGSDRTFLVQYDAGDGKRMETHVAADGKVVVKPRNAREQPFTILERKGD